MRRSKGIVLLVLSNVVLLATALWQAYLLRLPQRGSNPLPPPSAGQVNLPGNPSSSSAAPEAQAVDVVEPTSFTNHHSSGSTNLAIMDWQRIESSDYRTYIQNLRAIRCPEQTVRDIVSADLLKAFASKREAVLEARYRDFKFWKSDGEEVAARQQVEQQQRGVDNEMNSALHELLGADATAPVTAGAWKQAELEQQIGFLPEDKRATVLSTLLANATLDEQVQGLSQGRPTPEAPEERRRLMEAYDQQRTQLASLLTPEEYQTLDMTTSWTGDNLRRAMVHFQPTEEEFRAIFQAWRAHDENLALLYATGQPDPGNAQVYAKIRESLSPERYAQYVSTWWK